MCIDVWEWMDVEILNGLLGSLRAWGLISWVFKRLNPSGTEKQFRWRIWPI
jgi:hypothetical protein